MDVPENYISFAVPLFMVAIVVEALLGRKRHVYRLSTSLADLGVGIVSVVSDAFLRLVGLAVYAWVYERFRLVTFEPGSPWPWVLALVGVDLIYYWWHRLSHGINAFWAVHAVHHQSEDFNYAVALRQPALEATSVLVFFLPLALLGVSPVLYAASWAINLFYQFWIHTELVGKLGPLELVLNTPSHHRVHHGINPQYLDKNYGGILIVWDRLFSSFEEENEPVVYGVTKPLRSYNPVWANVEHWVTMWRLAKTATRFSDKLRVLVAHPAWRPGAPPDQPPEVSRDAFEKYDPRAPENLRGYVAFHFAATLALVGLFSFLEMTTSHTELLPVGGLIVLSIASVLAYVERRPWAVAVDRVRQLAYLGVLAFHLVRATAPMVAGVVLGATAVAFGAVYLRYRPGRALTPESSLAGT